MTTAAIANLEKLIGSPRDGAFLRYALANEWLKAEHPEAAVAALEAALAFDPHYSAAWKLLGKTLVAVGRPEAARDAYRQGIVVAEAKGDIQAAKEMKVFLKRLERDNPAEAP